MKTLKHISIVGTTLLSACAAFGPNIQEVCGLQRQQQATAHRADSTRQIADTLERSMQGAKASLASNRSHLNGQCVMVEQRSIPPKPQTLPDHDITLQAVGSAVELGTRRFSHQEIVEALMAVRMDDYLKAYAIWKQGNPEPCAMISPSQMGGWMCNNIAVIAGREAKYSCIQDEIKNFAVQAMQSCRALLSQWEAQVAAITSEPQQLQTDCQRDLRIIADAEKRLPTLRMEEAINREESGKLLSRIHAMLRGARLAPSACAALR